MHLWPGLTSGLIVFIVALTGSILVVEDELDAFFNTEFYKAVSVSQKNCWLMAVFQI
ncbi:PepSY domain-containing protein [Flavobacterium gelatinilyticum]|uniref:PepSY domain-containing protein n=1 Tax=Flavobacterium gelatinilyticum TaxID=3003260 RepID=UPI002480921D|nr:PepSY-associated TM helix domain-containing protein [Flavobacterium gelatinilyticum]